MINLQDFIGNSDMFKKFEVDDLLFVEFKCPIEEQKSILWWHNNFFVYVLTGETILKTPNNEYFIKAGDCAFAKKGSVIMRSHTHENFCELIVFLPDDFIKTVILKHKLSLHTHSPNEGIDTVISLFSDEVLITYFHSLLTYFQQPNPPSKTLLKLKFEELIINILSNNKHMPLQYYFSELCSTTKPSIKEIITYLEMIIKKTM